MVLNKKFKFVSVKERISHPILFVCFYLSVSLILRLIFYFNFAEPKSFFSLINVVLYGFISDIVGSFILFIPLFLFFIIFYEKIFTKKVFKWSYVFFIFIYSSFQIFLFFIEYFFFDEFNSRFNAVAVDYLIYPTEVFINIWQSYNVVSIILISIVLGLPFSIFLYKKLKNNCIVYEKLSSSYKFFLSFLYFLVVLIFLIIGY